MLSGSSVSLARLASAGQLSSATSAEQSSAKVTTKMQQKAARAKRCRSLLMLSSPFSSATTASVKSSLMSLLQPNSASHQQDQQQQVQLQQRELEVARRLSGDSHTMDGSSSSSFKTQQKQQQRGAKCIKMRLFEQPLDKLFSAKAMRQLNSSLASQSVNNSPPDAGAALFSKRKRSVSSAGLTYTLRSRLVGGADHNNNSDNNSSGQHKQQQQLSASQRRELLLSVMPAPIRNLLSELYLRGPNTVGIFRKSPNAKHCKELRQKLETDSQSSIEQFQVTVIASVFKEWLRSLPDCLLMSRLYPQWIDVTKLIEPLHLHRQQQLQLEQQLAGEQVSQQQQERRSAEATATEATAAPIAAEDDSHSDNTISGNTNLRPSRSLLTDKGQQPLDRARSCATMMSGFSIKINANDSSSTSNSDCGSSSPIRGNKPSPSVSDAGSSADSAVSSEATAASSSSAAASVKMLPQPHYHYHSKESQSLLHQRPLNQQQQSPNMSAFALSERHSECLRIVRQLLDTLNEPNLIMLSSFVSVLWHIASNSEENKMSAANLGVCVGQSLLNDEHQNGGNNGNGAFGAGSIYSNKSNCSTFSKRHRRTRSQCLLSSTLSLSSSNLQTQNYLSSSYAQETAKYVPMLVAFMIENAPALFGSEITSLFADHAEKQQQQLQTVNSNERKGENLRIPSELVSSFDQVDHGRQQQSAMAALAPETAVPTAGNNNNSSPLASSLSLSLCSSSSCREVEAAEEKEENEEVEEEEEENKAPAIKQQQIVVDASGRHRAPDVVDAGSLVIVGGAASETAATTTTTSSGIGNGSHQDCAPTAEATTTSILIVNHPPKRQHQQERVPPAQQRPLSATESTSSSRASSSTSGVHSESPAFSSELDSHTARTSASASPSSSVSVSVSAPSSPIQGEPTSSEDEQQQQQQRDYRHLSRHQNHRHHRLVLERHHAELGVSLDRHDSFMTIGRDSRSHQALLAPEEAPTAVGGAGAEAVIMATAAASDNEQPNSLACATRGARRAAEELAAEGPYQNSSRTHTMINRYSAFVGVLNRAPKIPVQFTTSSYGGEAVIYNPRSSCQLQAQQSGDISMDHWPVQQQQQRRLSFYSVNAEVGSQQTKKDEESVISLKPLVSQQERQQQQPQQYGLGQRNQQDQLREQRLNEFLAHQHQHHQQHQQLRRHTTQLSAAASLPYLPQMQSNYIPRQNLLALNDCHQAHQQAVGCGDISLAGSCHLLAQHQHQQQHPVFYAPANLSSLQQLQQHDRYMMYNRASLQPQRSHVMSLRDYYLSLHHQGQQQQQSFRPASSQFRPQSQLMPQRQTSTTRSSGNGSKLQCQSSQYEQQQQQQKVLMAQRQYLAANRTVCVNEQQSAKQATSAPSAQSMPPTKSQHSGNSISGSGGGGDDVASMVVGLTSHQPMLQRPQPRLAKIRQNQLNGAGLYVNGSQSGRAQQPQPTAALTCRQRSQAACALSSSQTVCAGGIKLPSSDNSSSADESDESVNDWRESTMV